MTGLSDGSKVADASHARRRQIIRSGCCLRPVLLEGARWDGSGNVVWSTAAEPGGLWHKSCGNRREAICPPCAEVYRNDAFQLVGAGLRGGKGVPKTVARHPLIFATLTAPSFGAVHGRVVGSDGKPRRCRPRRDGPICEHGRPQFCNQVHGEDDSCLGEPICPECWDYTGAVLTNNLLSELWRRTTIYLPRQLALLLGITQKRLREQVRISYAKVAEYQKRGLVHLHPVIRLDKAMPAYRREEVRPPDRRFTPDLLEQALRVTVAAVTVPIPAEAGGGYLTWGPQLDIQQIGGAGMEPGRCASYLAKYATKATEQAGGVLHRVSHHEIDKLPVSGHVRELMRTAFTLVGVVGADRRLAQNAHNFGFRGHCLTKSRRYSTTFKALRAERERYREEQRRTLDGPSAASPDGVGGDYTAFEFKGAMPLTTVERDFALREWLRRRERRRTTERP